MNPRMRAPSVPDRSFCRFLITSTINLHVDTGSSDKRQYGIDHREPITHSLMKYSWNRSSFVSSGWKVVKKCRPCRSATNVLGSSEWSGVDNDGGRRLGDSRAMTSIGGSKGDGLNSRTTCRVKDVIKTGKCDRESDHLPAHGWIFLWMAGQDSEVWAHVCQLQKIRPSLSLDNEI